MSKAKISKIMIWPSRTIGLPNYSSVTLNAGVEMVLDPPVSTGSKYIKTAIREARAVIKEEMKIQYEPIKKKYGGKGGEIK